MRTSEEISDLAAAWVAVQSKLPSPAADQVADTGKYTYKYAALNDVLNTTRPVLAEHGLAVLQSVGQSEDGVAVTSRLVHSSGQWVEDTLTMPLPGTGPQDVGKVISYARRYAYMAICGLATEDDDAQSPQTQAGKPKAQPKATEKKQEEWTWPFGPEHMKGRTLPELPASFIFGFVLTDDFEDEKVKEKVAAYAENLARPRDVDWLVWLARYVDPDKGAELEQRVKEKRDANHGQIGRKWADAAMARVSMGITEEHLDELADLFNQGVEPEEAADNRRQEDQDELADIAFGEEEYEEAE